MTHTPGPWGVLQGDMIYAKGGRLIADCERTPYEKRPAPLDTHDAANAAFIVRACNSHEAMLEALQLAQFALLSMPNDVKAHLPGNVLPAMQQAIRLAEGRP